MSINTHHKPPVVTEGVPSSYITISSDVNDLKNKVLKIEKDIEKIKLKEE